MIVERYVEDGRIIAIKGDDREDNKAKFHTYSARYRAVQLERTLTGIDNLYSEVLLIYEEAEEDCKHLNST